MLCTVLTSTNHIPTLTPMKEFFMGGHTLEQPLLLGQISPRALREQVQFSEQFHVTTAAIVSAMGRIQVKANKNNPRRRFRPKFLQQKEWIKVGQN